MDLGPVEVRVLGCLVEKQQTTPDQYPLSLNALRLACNQSTNRDPVEAVEKGLLRRDVFYRLNVFTVPLPPLRERGSDVALLAQHFIGEFNEKHGAAVEGVADGAGGRLAGEVREWHRLCKEALDRAVAGWRP